MKCFIHLNEEAIAACRQCGKGMCANCSAYSSHSGICPECRRKEFESKITSLQSERQDNVWSIVKWAFASVLVVTIPFSLYFIAANVLRNKKIDEEVYRLEGEVKKLSKALSNGRAVI